VQQALNLDALRASHPIEVPVRNALEVDQIFDQISYQKGSSVIRMLSNHLGRDVFLKGVGDYLKIHAYGNAKTDDLWAALSAASGQDVKTFMDAWIKKIGFPVITVAEEPGQITLQQQRFLSTGDVKAEEDETTWWVPVGLKTGSPANTVQKALTTKEDTLRDIDDSFYKINADQSGVYRTNYPPQRLVKLGQSLDRLSTEDKIGLMGDATALAISGDGTTPALLALLEGFKHEKSYLVWSQVSASLSKVRTVFSSNDKISDALRTFQRKLVSSAAESIGWNFNKDEDYLTVQLRKLLLGMAAGCRHEKTISEGKSKFASWKSGDQSAIHPNLRQVVFNLAIANGGDEEYDAVKQEYLSTTSVDGKEICLVALGKAPTVEKAKETLAFATSHDVAPQDAHSAVISVASNGKARIAAWEFTRDQWERVEKRLSGSGIIKDRWIKFGLSSYADQAIAEDIATFFKDKDTGSFNRSLVILSDTIRGNANYKARDEKVLLEWLEAHGYAA
jgi:aminopeptidase N